MSDMKDIKPSLKPDFFAIITYLNRLIKGQINPVGILTLANGATSTVLSDNNIRPTSFVFLFPRNAHAQAVFASLWADPSSIPAPVGGQVTIHHTNPGATDASFSYAIFT